MTNHELAAALRMCGQASGADYCESCPFFRGFDAKLCVPKLTSACADALENHETHVAALQREIEWLRRRVPQWVSVEERLPEQTDPAQTVLFATKTGGIFIGCYYKASVYDRFFGWYSQCAQICSVTHWMPLPEPPSTEGVE